MSDGRVRNGRKADGYTIPRQARCPSGEIIENARMNRNVSIYQVATKAKLSAGTLSNIERYGVITTKVCTLLSICKVLDLDPMELIQADVGNYYDGL